MSSSDHPAVLVVGAGPAGLITALALNKNGVPTRIIERRESFHGGIRGTFIQPRSIELLASLGVLDEVSNVSVPPYTIGVHGAGKEILSEMKWAEEADESPGTPYRCGFNVNQSVFERVLREQLEKKGVVVETGVELVGIEQMASAARARLLVDGNQHEEEFDYIVAADGARGSTRKALGVPFVGETKESDIIFTANVECHDVDREHWHRWGSIDTVSCLLKPVWPPPSFQIQALGPGLPKPLPQDTESIQKFFNDSTGSTDIKLKNTSWASEWRDNIRMAEKFRVGRVFLVGDAAHCHSPAGGQGMNSGMQDALNIAWKLALVHKGLAYPSLLDTYEVERMPVIAEMLAMTSKLHKLAFVSSLSVSALGEHHAGASAEQKVDHMFRPKTGLQLGVNCRWSPIVLDGRDTGAGQITLAQNPYGHDSAVLRAGDRAPDAPGLLEQPGGREARLFGVTEGCTQHTVLVFSGAAPAEDVNAAIEGLDRYRCGGIASVAVIVPQGSVAPACAGACVFVDGGGHAYGGYQIDPLSFMFVIVRPDGIIGAFATGLEQLHKYFSAIFL